MVVADPDKSLLIVCENGYGKRTLIGPGALPEEDVSAADEPSAADAVEADEAADEALPTDADTTLDADSEDAGDEPADGSDVDVTEARLTFRRQRRGGKGLRGIRATRRNGKVVDILAVSDDDEVLMVTAGGKIQRLRACDISQIGRDTQGVRVIRLDEGDTLVSCAAIAGQQIAAAEIEAAEIDPPGSGDAAQVAPGNSSDGDSDGDGDSDSDSDGDGDGDAVESPETT